MVAYISRKEYDNDCLFHCALQNPYLLQQRDEVEGEAEFDELLLNDTSEGVWSLIDEVCYLL